MGRSTKKKVKNYIYIVPVILWMAFIFYMSAKTGEGSSAVSNPITDLIVDIFQRARHDTAPAVDRMTGVVEVMVRKGAHMTEYGILMALLVLAVKKTCGKISAGWTYVWSTAITFAYACSDEIHQLFVADRAGKGSDVLIDMCGAVIALLIISGMKSTRGRVVTGFLYWWLRRCFCFCGRFNGDLVMGKLELDCCRWYINKDYEHQEMSDARLEDK